eukprot:3925721-Rhodomonas_salina.2
MDIAGLFQVQTKNEYYFFLVIVLVDDYSHKVFQDFCNYVGGAYKLVYVRAVQHYNTGEFLSNKFETFCTQNNIKGEYSAPYEQFQNAVAKNMVKIIKQESRLLLQQGHFRKKIWDWAAGHAMEVKNEIQCAANPGRASPNMLFYLRPQPVKMFLVFGCLTVLNCPKDTISDPSLDDHGITGIYVGLGFQHCRKCHHVWCPEDQSVYNCTHVQLTR